jgi:hypothetical protein
MESRREDASLRPVLAVHGNDLAGAQRAAAVDTEQLAQMPVRHAHIRRRQNAEDDDQHADQAKGIVGSHAAEARRKQRRRHEQHRRSDNHPEQQSKH